MSQYKKLTVLILLFVVFIIGALVLRNTNLKLNIPNPGTPSSQSITRNTWQLFEYANIAPDHSVPQGFVATAIFDSKGTVGGNGGCNSYSANYSIDGNKLKIEEIGSTLMACENNQEVEVVFMRNLLSSATYEVKDGILVIYDAYGNPTLKFKNAGNSE